VAEGCSASHVAYLDDTILLLGQTVLIVGPVGDGAGHQQAGLPLQGVVSVLSLVAELMTLSHGTYLGNETGPVSQPTTASNVLRERSAALNVAALGLPDAASRRTRYLPSAPVSCEAARLTEEQPQQLFAEMGQYSAMR
jgi:hypothetical protein